MGLFDKMKEPVFLKESSDARAQLEELKEFMLVAPENVKKQVDQDIKFLNYGIVGEDQVAFELKNSYMPMYILHDLYFEYEGLSAQIDYLIITKKVNIVIECKNLYGNIEINSNGDFIRTMDFGYGKKKEGIYSPITQNKRHLDLIKKMRSGDKGNILTKTLFEKAFDSNYKSLVVLANPKTILNMKYAKKGVKEQMIRCDQLIDNIKKLYNSSKNESLSEKDMLALAEYYLSKHTTNTTNYLNKYQTTMLNVDASPVVVEEAKCEPILVEDSVLDDLAVVKVEVMDYKEKSIDEKIKEGSESMGIENTAFYKALKEYRYKKSKEENIKAYFIYNNAQMEEVIKRTPNTMEELRVILQYGDVKCSKYGDDILSIVREHCKE